MGRFVKQVLLCIALWVIPSVYAADITGAGSSFAYPLLARWAQAYQQDTQQRVNYQSIGSGGGLSQLVQGTVDFAAVDIPQDPATLLRHGWRQYPLAVGGLVVAINVPGIPSNRLRLTGAVLADIFLGKITRWNDPVLQRLNPDLTLPAINIAVIHRADGSGTTYNFTQYLSSVSPEWAKQIGSATEVNWPTGIGGKGNNGVAMFTQRVPGSISYMEYSFANLTQLPMALLQNAAGRYVTPNFASFNAAVARTVWHPERHFQQLLINQPGENSWPIMATTFLLIPNAAPAKVKHAVQAFVRFGWLQQQDATLALDYVPLPATLLRLITQEWQSP